MAQLDQIKALMPDLIGGKTHEEMEKETALRHEQIGMHVEDGIIFPWLAPRSNLDALKTFQVRDDDVFVVTYPRSGTHWTAEIVEFILNEGKDDFSRSGMNSALEFTLVPDPSQLEGATPGYKTLAAMESPRCMGSHCHDSFLPPQVWTKQTKVVYVARNPKDMLVSLYRVAKAGPADRGPFENFDQLLWQFYFDEMVFTSWDVHVLNYWKRRNDGNVLFLKYEDLHKDLRGSICKIAQHIGKELSDDVIDRITECVTFGGMQKSYQKLEDEEGEEGKKKTKFGNAPHLRKGKVGDWKNTFTVAQNALFDKVYALKMQGTGLEFDFEL